MDFVTDRLDDGRPFRVLTVVDQFSRECVLLEAAGSLTGKSVAVALQGVVVTRGGPRAITVTTAASFIRTRWIRGRTATASSSTSSDRENPWRTPTSRASTDACATNASNTNLFLSLTDAREKLEAWRLDYNQRRPHSSLGDLTPAQYAERHRQQPAA